MSAPNYPKVSARRHILNPRPGILCSILLLAAAPLPAADNSIPWNQIGAKAGADYKGDGLSVTPSDSGARLHCVFQRLDAEASTEGLWLSSSVTNSDNDRFRVLATAIDGQALPARGTVTVDGQTVRFGRPGLQEEYTVSMDGIRQDFIIPESPDPREASWTAAALCRFSASDTTHHLILTLSITGARVEPSPGGATLILDNSHRRIAYNRLRVTDATGKQLPAHIEVSPAALTPETDTDAIFNPNPLNRTAALPLPKGPRCAKRTTISGQLTSGGLGKPLGWGEGEGKLMSFHDNPTEECRSSLSIVINDTSAIYPLRIDPTFSDANWISMGGVAGLGGPVNASVVDSFGNLFVGGSFSNAGTVFATNIAEWTNGSWKALGPGIGSPVQSLATSGGILYAGSSNVSQWNGTNWTTLGSGIGNGLVYALLPTGNLLYAGGSFPAYVAQWNGTNWTQVGTRMGTVLALAKMNGILYAGGEFTAPFSPGYYIAQWNGTNWSALGEGTSGNVRALTVSGNTLYVGGDFYSVGDQAASHVATWDGSNWSPVYSGLPGNVYALYVSSNGTIYAGGAFNYENATSAYNGVSQFTGSGNWEVLGSGMTQGSTVTTLAFLGSNLYAGGNFTEADGHGLSYEGQWNGSNWSGLGSGLNGYVDAFAVSQNTLYVGGSFNVPSASASADIAQWNGYAWSPLGTGMNDTVTALALSGPTLYAGGYFTTAGGNAANYIAQWNGSSWSALGSGMGGGYGPTYVNALAVSGSTLYVGGNFTTAGTNGANYIAQWVGTNWSPLSSGMNFKVYALAVSGANLYAGGEFATAGDVTNANCIAQWDGVSWSALGSGMAFGNSSASVNSLAVSPNGTLYAGGYFATAGDIAANFVSQWNGSSWSAMGSGMNSPVLALVLSDGTLYAGGYFTSAGGISVNNIAQWNGSTWAALGSGLNNQVSALALSGGTLYAGGSFTTAGTNVSGYIAEAILPIAVSILTTDGNFGFTNGLFGFDISGPPNSNIIIQTSTDLQNWIPLQTNTLNTNGLLYFSDSQSPITTRRFYQAVLP